jgi:hypothetical protein
MQSKANEERLVLHGAGWLLMPERKTPVPLGGLHKEDLQSHPIHPALRAIEESFDEKRCRADDFLNAGPARAGLDSE